MSDKTCGSCKHWDRQPPPGPSQEPVGPCRDPRRQDRISITGYESWHGCHTGGWEPVEGKEPIQQPEEVSNVMTTAMSSQPCAVISGTSSGIGEVLRNTLLREGWKVYTIERSPIGRCHDNHYPYAGDVSDILDVRAVFKRIRQAEKRAPHVLVNNAAVNKIQFLMSYEPKAFCEVVDTVIKGTFYMCQSYINLIRDLETEHEIPKFKPAYRIVNIGSLAGRIPMTATLPYNTAKAGLNMMTKQMARELAPNIVTCAVNPGKVSDTGMTDQLDSEIPEIRGWTKEFADEYQMGVIPMKKYTTPEDVVEIVLFAMTCPDFINGSIIDFDGGVS